jgi:hypothetical protein
MQHENGSELRAPSTLTQIPESQSRGWVEQRVQRSTHLESGPPGYPRMRMHILGYPGIFKDIHSHPGITWDIQGYLRIYGNSGT